MQRIAICLLASSLVLGCAGAPEDLNATGDTIIHGDEVPADGFPTVGLMMVVATASRNGSPAVRQPLSLCTGTLISPTAVLLAAHCVDSMIRDQSLQRAGITITGEVDFRFTYENSVYDFIENTPQGRHFNEKPSLLRVASTEQMPINALGALQRPGKMDDIALLHLAAPVKGKPVQMLATPEIAGGMATNSLHAVAGYGQTSNDPGDFNGDGMEDPAEASAGTLHSGVSKLNQMGANEIIAGNMDEQQACRGDSGGPIFVDQTTAVQLGIASRINAFPNPFDPNPPRCEPGLVYTRVDAYLSWIQQHVPDLGQPTEPCLPNDPDPSCGGAGSQTGDPDAGADPDPDAGEPGSPDAGTGPGPGPDPGSPDAGEDNPDDGGDGDQAGGCGCTVASAHTRTPGALAFLLVGAIVTFVGARRRRHRL